MARFRVAAVFRAVPLGDLGRRHKSEHGRYESQHQVHKSEHRRYESPSIRCTSLSAADTSPSPLTPDLSI